MLFVYLMTYMDTIKRSTVLMDFRNTGLLTLFLLLFGSALNAQTCCTVPGYQYSRTVTINNTGGPAYTNIQVLFVFNSQTPIGQGKMNASGNDIRFKDANCGANLSYWIESGINTNATNIWIKIPSIAANAVKTITLFYGNPAAAPISAFGAIFTNVYTAAGVQTLTGVQNYDWFEIPAGATINTQAGQLLTINARRVKINGTINGNNNGYGSAAGPGAGGSGGGGTGGGGGGYGGAGGTGGSNNGGPANGTASGTDINRGSGGGGSDCGPTAPGGGAVRIQSEATEITGNITMNGGGAAACCCNNNSEAAAGGSGGGIYVDGRYITGTGTLNANGGAGGNSSDKEGGGGGGGGRIKLFACTQNGFTGTATVLGGPNGSGGLNGMQPGANGTFRQNPCNRYVISVAPEVELPVADFTTGNVCDGSPVNFTDASSVAQANITDWGWDFGDGNTSIQQNPTHTYATPNTYNVTLAVITDAGCTATNTLPVTVNPVPVADFSFADDCASAMVSFTDNSSISSGTVQTWSWDFGDGSALDNSQNPTHTYLQPNSYDVTLDIESDNGCLASSTQTIVISPVPVADFSATSACEGNATVFTDNSAVSTGNITQWSWDFDDGNSSIVQSPSHLYASAGNYSVSLTVTTDNGCQHTVSLPVVVNPEAISDFSATSECQGTPTMFTDMSSVASGQITAYDWDFADNSGTSAQPSPMYIYTAAGNFAVTLTITTDFGCEASVTHQVDVYANPIPNFSVADVCLGEASQFNDLSSIPSGFIVDWQYDFGDGSGAASVAGPSYTYSTSGQFDVELTTTSDNGCVVSITLPDLVNPNPVADFNFTDVCQTMPNMFTDVSSVSSGNITQWDWDFGDGSTNAITQDANHIYGSFGTFDVTLTATTAAGCTDDTMQTAEVFPGVVTDFSATTVCEGNITEFTDLSVASGSSTIIDWSWNLGGGSSAALQNPDHTYAGFGQYDVVLTTETDNGCTGSKTIPVLVHAVPTAQFATTPVCLQETTIFTDQSTIANGSIAQRNWDFGDGGTSTQNSPNHLYTTDGDFATTLVVISDQSCSDTLIQNTTVYPLPEVAFTASVTDGCMPLDVSFTDGTTINSGALISWNWILGGFTSSTQNPDFVLEQVGTYDVSLVVVSDQGCSSVLTSPNHITVHPLPSAAFSWEPNIPDILDPTVQFTDGSQSAVAWYWDFGDGNISTNQHPINIFPDTGIFVVQLIAENQFGCLDTVEQELYVKPTFLLYIPNAFSPNADRVNDVFRAEGMGIRDFEMMIFDRWGEKIFYSNDILVGWDGLRSNGEHFRPGVYVYRILVRNLVNDHLQDFNGKVHLIR